MNININKCINADKKTKTTCSKKHPISPDAEREEKFKAARNYGQCAFSNMASNLDANRGKFGKCLTSSKHIEKIIRKAK